MRIQVQLQTKSLHALKQFGGKKQSNAKFYFNETNWKAHREIDILPVSLSSWNSVQLME